MSAPRVAVVGPFKPWGGLERKVTILAREFLELGVASEIVLVRGGVAPYPDRLPPEVRVVDLGTRAKVDGVLRLARYLRETRPDAVLTVKDHGAKLAVLARALARLSVPLHVKVTNTLSQTLRRPLQRLGVRWLYPRADGVIAISRGVRDDLVAHFGLPAERVRVIYNPMVTPDFPARLAAPAPHPWLAEGAGVPVVLGAGRLTAQKGFDVLIEAFARLRRTRACRLIILGEGPLRAALEARAGALGVATDVDLPGMVPDPLPYMGRAALFALSSRYEGLGNVVIEALAAGAPVVSTDCPSGPAEILEGGRYGELVPVEDTDALASAMARALEAPRRAPAGATERFLSSAVARQYLDTLGLPHR